MKNFLVPVLLVSGLLSVAFFTYKAHERSLGAAEQATDLQQAISDYDYILLQITNAYQQNLIYALSREMADMDTYFASEDRVYDKLSHIEQLTSFLDGMALPSDSLRPLVARQFLRMERYRLRADDSEPETSLQMLDEALDDQKRIEQLIKGDTGKIEDALSEISHSDLLTPVFIFFLFLSGAAGLLYARSQLSTVRMEVLGMEEKLRKNQQILHTQIDQNEALQDRLRTMMDLTGQLSFILKPVYAHGDVEDFKVSAANAKAIEIFGLQEGSPIKAAFKENASNLRDWHDIFGWLIDAFESGKPSRGVFQAGFGQNHRGIALIAVPHDGQLFLSSQGAGDPDADVTANGGIPASLFGMTGFHLAEVSPQGKVTRINAAMRSEYPEIEGRYLWDIPVFSDQDSKHELRKLIRSLDRGEQHSGEYMNARFAGIFNNEGILISILYILLDDKSTVE